ncbi:MAG: DNA alkylation repair protein [Bacteroidia bacterium]|nr:DNA alkylation repair protein [Bacteroidia bacterium]
MAYKKLKYWFDEELAILLSNKIKRIDPDFDSTQFVESISPQLEGLELKDRVELIADVMFSRFEGNYETGVNKLLKILGPENPKETGMFKEYYWIMPIAKFVEKYGLQHFNLSMDALEAITKRNTGEYAIRPFLETDTKRTLSKMKSWSRHPNKHVRRLSSEGLRPRLPWARKLDIFIKDPRPIIPILENLKDDASRYVQKSVANCLNDIIKDNPIIGKATIESWNVHNIGDERKWIIKHALRNLLKQQDPWAFLVIQK